MTLLPREKQVWQGTDKELSLRVRAKLCANVQCLQLAALISAITTTLKQQ